MNKIRGIYYVSACENTLNILQFTLITAHFILSSHTKYISGVILPPSANFR